MSASVHVYPVRAEHETEGLDCWCGPRYGLPCDECSEPIEEPNDDGTQIVEQGAGCWKCEAGLIYLTRDAAELADVPLVIIHNDVQPGA